MSKLEKLKSKPLFESCKKQFFKGIFRPSRKYCNNNCKEKQCERFKE